MMRRSCGRSDPSSARDPARIPPMPDVRSDCRSSQRRTHPGDGAAVARSDRMESTSRPRDPPGTSRPAAVLSWKGNAEPCCGMVGEVGRGVAKPSHGQSLERWAIALKCVEPPGTYGFIAARGTSFLGCACAALLRFAGGALLRLAGSAFLGCTGSTFLGRTGGAFLGGASGRGTASCATTGTRATCQGCGGDDGGGQCTGEFGCESAHA